MLKYRKANVNHSQEANEIGLNNESTKEKLNAWK
jgi:hypothetical protein